MREDARFRDGASGLPLKLRAFDGEDLDIISSLLQDAVLPAAEMTWLPTERRFAMLVNRFRWEQFARNGKCERVQSLIIINDVMKVCSSGFDQNAQDLVLSLLAMRFEPGKDGTGRLLLTLAGDGEIALDVECVDIALKDVSRPYPAPSGKAPTHPVDEGEEL